MVSPEATKFRARFVLALLKAYPRLEESVWQTTSFLDSLHAVGLPRWEWFPEIAQDYIKELTLWRTAKSELEKSGNLSQSPELKDPLGYLTSLWDDYNMSEEKYGGCLPNLTEDDPLVPTLFPWRPEVETKTEWRRGVENALRAYEAEVAEKHQNSVKQRTEKISNQHFEATARRFIGETPSQIARALKLRDGKAVDHIVQNICERCQINLSDLPAVPRGRPRKSGI